MGADLATLLPFRSAREHARIRLVCLPFAGGAAAGYRHWAASLPDYVDVCAVELPGRGTRFSEAALTSLEHVREDLAVLGDLGELPFVLFGHSMGARVGFALVRGGFRADAVIMSGSRAAHIPSPVRSSLPHAALVQELKRIGGTPREVLEDDELLAMVLPTLRADLRLLEQLRPSIHDKISCPMTVLAASDDVETPIDEATQWKHHAAGEYRFVTFDGGHFFLASRTNAVLLEVRRVLDEVLLRA